MADLQREQVARVLCEQAIELGAVPFPPPTA
jgi:hypothetical protein